MRKTQEKIREQVGYKFPIPKPPIKRNISIIRKDNDNKQISSADINRKEANEIKENKNNKDKDKQKLMNLNEYILSKTHSDQFEIVKAQKVNDDINEYESDISNQLSENNKENEVEDRDVKV